MNAMTQITRKLSQPIAQWTLAERVANARIENKMIAEIKPLNTRPAQNDCRFGRPSSTAQGEEARQAVLAVIDTPKRAKVIAAEINMNVNTVNSVLMNLELAGLAVKAGRERFMGQTQHHNANTWVRT